MRVRDAREILWKDAQFEAAIVLQCAMRANVARRRLAQLGFVPVLSAGSTCALAATLLRIFADFNVLVDQDKAASLHEAAENGGGGGGGERGRGQDVAVQRPATAGLYVGMVPHVSVCVPCGRGYAERGEKMAGAVEGDGTMARARSSKREAMEMRARETAHETEVRLAIEAEDMYTHIMAATRAPVSTNSADDLVAPYGAGVWSEFGGGFLSRGRGRAAIALQCVVRGHRARTHTRRYAAVQCLQWYNVLLLARRRQQQAIAAARTLQRCARYLVEALAPTLSVVMLPRYSYILYSPLLVPAAAVHGITLYTAQDTTQHHIFSSLAHETPNITMWQQQGTAVRGTAAARNIQEKCIQERCMKGDDNLLRASTIWTYTQFATPLQHALPPAAAPSGRVVHEQQAQQQLKGAASLIPHGIRGIRGQSDSGCKTKWSIRQWLQDEMLQQYTGAARVQGILRARNLCAAATFGTRDWWMAARPAATTVQRVMRGHRGRELAAGVEQNLQFAHQERLRQQRMREAAPVLQARVRRVLATAVVQPQRHVRAEAAARLARYFQRALDNVHYIDLWLDAPTELPVTVTRALDGMSASYNLGRQAGEEGRGEGRSRGAQWIQGCVFDRCVSMDVCVYGCVGWGRGRGSAHVYECWCATEECG